MNIELREIIKNNKLIAEFRGLTIITDGISLFDTSYKPLQKYHESWDSLMSVVEQIESLSYKKWKALLFSKGKRFYTNKNKQYEKAIILQMGH